MVTEADLDQVMRERDEAQETADNLAHALAVITGADIGEHSSMNDPWHNALEAAENYRSSHGSEYGIWATTAPIGSRAATRDS